MVANMSHVLTSFRSPQRCREENFQPRSQLDDGQNKEIDLEEEDDDFDDFDENDLSQDSERPEDVRSADPMILRDGMDIFHYKLVYE